MAWHRQMAGGEYERTRSAKQLRAKRQKRQSNTKKMEQWGSKWIDKWNRPTNKGGKPQKGG